MKKVITLALSLAMTIGAFAAEPVITVCITKTGGGENGYKYISETSTTHPNGDVNHSLICSSPGTNECKFRITPINHVVDPANGNEYQIDFYDFETVVTNAIAEGETSGTIVILNTNNTIYWTQTDSGYCMNFTQDF